MREAIRQASKGSGLTSPNPPVGCVIVRGGEIIARGYHRRAGEPHAEIDALGRLGGRGRKGDTLYVTLEPCNHYGRTPPCTEAILGSGIQRVVVGAKDPNPGVAGGGCRFLAGKGVDVLSGVLESECRRLIEVFAKYSTTGLPFVVAKSALTLDGWSATSTGHSRWVTGERSRRFVHRLRERMDGVMVGVGTVLADDPSLTVRLAGRRRKEPVRIIVDTHLRIPARANVMRNGASLTLIAVGSKVPAGRRRALEREGVGILVCPERNGRVDLAALMKRLGERSITSLLLEGGATLMGSMIRERLVDKFYIFKAPKVLGGGDGIPMVSGPGAETMERCIRLGNLVVRRFGQDVLFMGYPDYGAVRRS